MKEHSLAILVSFLVAVLALSGLSLAQTGNPQIDAALKAKDFKTVEPLLKAAIQADPTLHYNYYLLGKVYYEQEKWNRAKEQFELALQKKGKDYESLYFLSRCQINLEELEEADKNLKEGLKKARDYTAWFENGTGLLLLKRGEYGEADKAFRRALATNEADLGKQIKDIRTKKLSDAEREAMIAELTARLAQEKAEYQVNLGDANFFLGVPSLAIAEYEKALQIDTASTEVYFHWAEACLELKDYTCAIGKLRQVLTKDSTYAPAWHRAGGIYFKAAMSSRDREERKGRFMDAIGSYNRFLELSGETPDSNNVRVFFELAMSYANIGGFENAKENFGKVVAIPYEPRDIYFWYGKSLWGVKDYVLAAELLEKHVIWVQQQGADYQSSIRDAELYQVLGDCYNYRQPKEYSTAARYYEKSLADNPNQNRVLKDLAVAYHSLKRFGEAIRYYDLRIAAGIDSADCSIYKNAGSCALNIATGAGAGDDEMLEGLEGEAAQVDQPIDPNKDYYVVAVDYLRKYLECSPNDTAAILRVANTYLYQMADCANGVAYFERLLQVDPNNCLAKKSLGYAYFSGVCTKDYTKALQYLKSAYDCFAASEGGCADVALIKFIAQCYHLRASEKNSSDDFRLAHEWYGKVLKCDPGDAEAQKLRDEISFEFNAN